MSLNKDNWGNQEIPGFEEEDIFSEKFLKKLRSSEAGQIGQMLRKMDPEFDALYRKKLKEGQDQEWYEKICSNAKIRSQDPEWLEKIAELNRTRKERLGPEYSKKVSESQKRRFMNMSPAEKKEWGDRCKAIQNDPEFVKKMRSLYYDNPVYLNEHKTRTKEVAQRPEMRKWYKEFNRAKRKDPEHLKKHEKGVKDRSTNNIEWIRKNCRPVKTPHGIFLKASQARDAYLAEHGGNKSTIGVYMRSWLKDSNNLDYQYLTWCEYEKMTKEK